MRVIVAAAMTLLVMSAAHADETSTVKQVSLDGELSATIRGSIETETQKLIGKTVDRAQAQSVAQQLTDILRKAGYPVGTILVTDQEWTSFIHSGDLHLRVFQGEVGRVVVQKNNSQVSNTRLQRTAMQALCGRTESSCALTSEGIERAELLLQDLPGVQLDLVSLSPEGVGVGQTSVGINADASERRLTGAVSVDNYGVVASGITRFNVGGQFSNLFHQGDVFQLGGQVTNRGQYTGLVGFSMPLGYSGWRVAGSAARTSYDLPQVDASGMAATGDIGISYPIARALDKNWVVGLDGYDTVSKQTVNDESAFAPRHLAGVRLSLVGNAGDRALDQGGSFWSGSLVGTAGRVAQSLPGLDITNTVGHYDKLAASLFDKQMLGNSNWYTLVNLHAQVADRNLDPYEAMSVGGVTGVRGYSASEGTVNQGVLLSTELRRLFVLPDGSKLAPGVWIDYLYGKVLHDPYPGWQTALGYTNSSMSNERSLGAWGLGLDYASPLGINGALTIGWKMPGSKPSAVGDGGGPYVLVTVGTRF